MNNNIVISQPMFLPWIGMFEQLKLADIFVHYDDVQFPQGSSFINRVQLKTKDGIKWLTVPIDKKNSGKLINETLISYNENWKDKHLSIIKQSFYKTKYEEDILSLIEKIYSKNFETISKLNIYAFELLADYFSFSKEFILSSSLNTNTSSSQKILDIVKRLNGKNYITGHGAKNYLDHELFEKNNINIMYMDYSHIEYPQKYGTFTPYVSILDLIANNGHKSINYFKPKTIGWKNFLLGE